MDLLTFPSVMTDKKKNSRKEQVVDESLSILASIIWLTKTDSVSSEGRKRSLGAAMDCVTSLGNGTGVLRPASSHIKPSNTAKT